MKPLLACYVPQSTFQNEMDKGKQQQLAPTAVSTSITKIFSEQLKHKTSWLFERTLTNVPKLPDELAVKNNSSLIPPLYYRPSPFT